jgi:hypothetical protein
MQFVYKAPHQMPEKNNCDLYWRVGIKTKIFQNIFLNTPLMYIERQLFIQQNSNGLHN